MGIEDHLPEGQRSQREKFTKARKRRFCEELAKTGLKFDTCLKIGVCEETVRKHRRLDPEFAKDYEDAFQQFREGLQKEAYRRAVLGNEKGMYFQGQRIKDIDPETGEVTPVTVKEYDTPLLILLLKRHCPEFNDKKVVENRNVNLDIADMEKLSPDQLKKLRELLETSDGDDE
jgi:CRISPR/Cas system-associated protein endoribonuclease Cas2